MWPQLAISYGPPLLIVKDQRQAPMTSSEKTYGTWGYNVYRDGASCLNKCGVNPIGGDRQNTFLMAFNEHHFGSICQLYDAHIVVLCVSLG